MTKVKLTNHVDQVNALQGRLLPAQVRSVEVEGLVDTGATTLIIPEDVSTALGLNQLGTKKLRLADGSVVEVPRVTGLLVEILGRDMECDALVLPAGTRTLIGQIPLEALDLVVDPKSGDLRPNPDHPDAPIAYA